MATAAYGQDIDHAAEELVFDAVTEGVLPCSTFRVSALVSNNSVLVRIPGLHEAGEQAVVQAGQTKEFRHGDGGISLVYLQASADDNEIDYEIAARTETASA